MNDTQKFCKDCKHARPRLYRAWPWQKWRFDWDSARCAANHKPFYHPVHGRDVQKDWFCEFERMEKGKCGPDGKLFEPKGGGVVSLKGVA